MDTINTLDKNEDQNYEEIRSIKPTGVNLRRLEQKYMGNRKS